MLPKIAYLKGKREFCWYKAILIVLPDCTHLGTDRFLRPKDGEVGGRWFLRGGVIFLNELFGEGGNFYLVRKVRGVKF